MRETWQRTERTTAVSACADRTRVLVRLQVVRMTQRTFINHNARVRARDQHAPMCVHSVRINA